MTLAVVPACGHSTRMGRTKLALPLGNRTVIERVVAALRDGGVAHIVVVTGAHVPELATLAAAVGAEVLALPEATVDMRTTVERGLDWIEAHHDPDSNEGWLLTPADQPGISADVVMRVIAAGRESPGSIIVPVHGGRRGHPALLRWRHVVGIRSLESNIGINSFMRQNAETRELPVETSGILADLDTPEDYRAHSGYWNE